MFRKKDNNCGECLYGYFESCIIVSLQNNERDLSSNSKFRDTCMTVRGGSRTAATSKMELFVIIVNGFEPLTIITKCSILDVAAVLDPPLEVLIIIGISEKVIPNNMTILSYRFDTIMNCINLRYEKHMKSNFSSPVLYGLTDSFVGKTSFDRFLMVIDHSNTNILASKY